MKVPVNDIVFGTALPDQLIRLIENDFVRRQPKIPLKLPRFDSTDLPAAAQYEGCLIYCPDTQQFRGSNGTTWGVL